MKQYILNLIPRLTQFGHSLSKKELFIDVPWVFVDEKSNQEKYIFKRNGELIMSLNGQVTIGKWEYLATANSLLVDRVHDKILLNHAFLDPAVMVLKKDGYNDNVLFLANQNLIPDLDILGYLSALFIKKNNISQVELIDGKILQIHNCLPGFVQTNLEVSFEGKPISDGLLAPTKSGKICLIKDSKIQKILVKQEYETRFGIITIEKEANASPKFGDLVFKDNRPAPDGKYRLAFLYHIAVKDGRIIKA